MSEEQPHCFWSYWGQKKKFLEIVTTSVIADILIKFPQHFDMTKAAIDFLLFRNEASNGILNRIESFWLRSHNFNFVNTLRNKFHDGFWLNLFQEVYEVWASMTNLQFSISYLLYQVKLIIMDDNPQPLMNSQPER